MSEDPGSTEQTRRIRNELLYTFASTLAAVLLLSIAAQFVGLLARNLTLFVALAFLLAGYLNVDARNRDPRAFGMTADRFLAGLGWGLAATLLTIVPFFAGYWIWETQWRGRTASLDVDNLRQWSSSDRGIPEPWRNLPDGQSVPQSGVWSWAEERRLLVGLATNNQPVSLELQCSPACEPSIRGPARLSQKARSSAGEPVGDNSGDDTDSGATHWLVRLTTPSTRARLAIDAPAPADADRPPPPDSVSLTLQAPEGVEIRRGPDAERVGRSATFQRGFSWLLITLIAQIVLIALPEEFFYRGYVQTRIRQWWTADARSDASASPEDETAGTTVRDGPTESRRPGWLGITPENALASALFALGHLVIPVGGQILPNRVAVFFPALVFGWLRDRTGYITASVTYHTACNLLVLLAAAHFFR